MLSLESAVESELRLLEFLNLTAEQLQLLVQELTIYIRLLEKWSQAMNLTAVRDPFLMVSRHIVDSLKLLPYLTSSERILDVGTGAGLPGIPLSLVLKQKQFTLLDSKLKKQLFLEQVVQDLKLENVNLKCIRVESYQPPILFDTIISRAFAPLSKMLSLTGHLLAPGGRFLAMKGRADSDELTSIGTNYKIESVVNLQSFIHNQTEARHLVIVKRTTEEIDG